MKSLLWFVLGLAGGFVAAHLVNKDPRGHEALVEVDARIAEFTDRIGEAYRAQEAKIDGIAAEVKDAAANALGAAKDAAADAIDAAGDAASTAASAAKKTAAQLTD
ncbi:ATPase [Microbacterium lacticum]